MLRTKAKPFVAVMLILALFGFTSIAGASEILSERPTIEAPGQEPSGGDMLLDIALVRPMSFVGLLIGSVTWVVAAPFALIADGTDGIEKISGPLVVEPAKYTFVRPVGEM